MEWPSLVNTASDGYGLFSLIGNQLPHIIPYSGLFWPATAAHIHGPADTNGMAGVLQPLTGTLGTSGTLTGTLVLPQNQLGYLMDGLIYGNIHTTNNPGGEIRGQIVFQ